MSTEMQKTNWNLLTQLRQALKQQNKKQAKQLLLRNTIVDDVKCKSAHTLIHWAIIKFHDTEILEILIDQGANIYAKNFRRQTPLTLAIEEEHVKAVELLMNKKAYVGADFQSILKTAINTKSETIVKLLIDCGAKNKLFEDLNDVLYIAMKNKLAKIVKSIIPYCKLEKAEKYVSEFTIGLGGHEFYECLNVLLEHGFKMEPGCEKSSSIVFDSVESGYLAILEELLSLGLNVNMMNEITGLTLLHTACLFSQHKVAELLLKHHADINCLSKDGILTWHTNYWAEETKLLSRKTPLFIAVKCKDVKLLEILLNHGANIPHDPDFISLINLVIQKDNLEILKVLINHGLNVNATMTDGRTLLHECANCEIPFIYLCTSQSTQFNDGIKHQIAQLLVENGADVDAHNPNGETPLFIAIKNNYSKMVNFLLEHNANVHHKNIDGDTPLHTITKEPWIFATIVIRLLEYKANVNEPNVFGMTPFHFACKNGSANLIQILIDHGADINSRDRNGQSAIYFAAEGLDNQVTRLLLKNGACMKDHDNYNRTPLHILCKHSMVTNEDIEIYLRHGADINAIDCHHRTPLFYACKSGRLETVKMLLNHQANVNHVDIFGKTPVYVAAIHFPEIAEFLMDQEITNTDFIIQDGKTLLHAFVQGNQIDIIDEYMDTLNIHINTADNFGKTPLFYAAAKVQEDIVIMLLRHGADINVSNNQQPTVPMDIDTRLNAINRDITEFLDSLCESFDVVDNGLRLRDEYVPQWKNMGCYMRIMQVLRQDIIKLKAADQGIHPQNVRFSIYDDKNVDIYVDDVYNANLSRYQSLCETEVITLQMEKIPGTDFSLYDILVKDTHILANHISLEEVESFLHEDYLRETFPIYIDLINYRVSLAVRRSKLLDIARDRVETSIFFGIPVLCTNQIFSYLNNNEIKILNQSVNVEEHLNQAEIGDLKTDSAQFLTKLKRIEIDSDESMIQPTKKFKIY